MTLRGVSLKALLGSAVLMALALGTSFWLITAEQQRLYNEDLTRQLLAAARLVRETLREAWDPFDAGRVAGLVHTLRTDGVSVVILSADGGVLVDTTEGAPFVEGLLEQAEVRQALLVGWGERTGRLPGDAEERKIVAVRAGDDESMLGVVWLARPTWTLRAAWSSIGRLVGIIGIIAFVSALLLALVLTYLRARLLERLAETARSLSAGDLSARADVAGSDEYATLSSALNQMRRRLAAQVTTIDRQRLTLASLVDQLDEGVVVARPDGRLALINPAAIRLLNLAASAPLDPKRLVGLPLERCVPQHDLQVLLRHPQPSGAGSDGSGSAHAAAGETPARRPDAQEGKLQIETRDGPVQLLARASDVELPGEPGGTDRAAPGRMLVLTDITELTRTLRVKSDFVANASHELRTPLTAIRAAVETLRQMDLADGAGAAPRFIDAIARQSARLEALIADLLDLSRLEAPGGHFEPQSLDLARLLEELHERFAERIARGGVRWETHCEGAVPPRIVAHPHLLRVTLDNLVDNAIKFSARDGLVRVTCTRGPEWLAFEVADEGCGIPEPEQQRVFERFYQVEQARSKHEAGTGLGLSIVRHAVAAMNGTVELRSAVGRGTRVTVRIPQAAAGGKREGFRA